MRSGGLGERRSSAPLAGNSGSGALDGGAGELKSSPACLGQNILSMLVMVGDWFPVQIVLELVASAQAQDLRTVRISPSVLEMLDFRVCLVVNNLDDVILMCHPPRKFTFQFDVEPFWVLFCS